MKDEWGSLLENLTFEFDGDGLAPDATSKAIGNGLPSNASNATLKAIGSKWVFRTKPNPDGPIKFKARLVIQGYEQVKGIDFNETYAPVSKLLTLHMLLAIAAQRSWKIDHMDVRHRPFAIQVNRVTKESALRSQASSKALYTADPTLYIKDGALLLL
jgi:hypothetical protein